jgi:hypothetical protein
MRPNKEIGHFGQHSQAENGLAKSAEIVLVV